MLTRRRFATLALGSSALTGCAGFLRLPPIGQVDARGTIDVHVHFINGTDVPVLGFLKQVDFVGNHGGDHDGGQGGGVPGFAKSRLIAFVVGLLADLTPDAETELRALPPVVPRQSRRVLEARDESRLAEYLEQYEQGATDTQRLVRSRIRTAAADDGPSTVLAILEDAAGVRQAEILAAPPADGNGPPGVILRQQAMPPDAQPTAAETARGLMDPAAQGGDPQRLSIAGLIRWAMLLTRPRSEIMQQAFALYGRPSEARVFCNHMLDLGSWLTADERKESPMKDQIELMSALAQREKQVLVLNFAPFCPLRAVADGIGKTLNLVQDAVVNRGFAGVKLYPPMGFRPDSNSGVSLAHSRHPRLNPADMDGALTELYRWCASNDVPIASHASRTMGAGRGTAAYAAPRFWGPVLARHPGLRVNLAHFGGFRRHGDAWGTELAGLVEDHATLYFDTGYWTEAGPTRPGYDAELAATTMMLSDHPKLAQRMLYGSDWSMIAKEPDHPSYLLHKRNFLRKAAGGDEGRDAILGGNARRWLGIDRQGQQAERLAAFFAGHPAWDQIAPS